MSEAQWQEPMTLDFHRPRQLGDALVDGMIARQWGRIINITGKSEPEHINGAFCAKAGMHSPRARYITGAVIPVDGGLRRYQS